VPDLSFDNHVSNVFLLAQASSADTCSSIIGRSVKTMVHAFVTSRVDYCNSVSASAPKIITYKLQSVLNAAARLITGTQ